MAGQVDNVIIEHLKALRSDVQTLRSEKHVEFEDTKLRLSSVDSAIVSMKQEFADTRGDCLSQ